MSTLLTSYLANQQCHTAMPLVDENEFDHFLDVAVRDESDTDAFRRARRRPSELGIINMRNEDGSSGISRGSDPNPEPLLLAEHVRNVSAGKSERATSGSSYTSVAAMGENTPTENELHSSNSCPEGTPSDSPTIVSEHQEDDPAESNPEMDRIIELEDDVARLKFQAADYRAQSDYYRMQHRQLRLQFEDLQAFCQQLQNENEELRDLHQTDSHKRAGSIWPFHKEEATKLGPPISPPDSLSQVYFEPYSAPEQVHEEKLRATHENTPKLSSRPAESNLVNADTQSSPKSSSETTSRAGNVESPEFEEEYANLSLEDEQSDNLQRTRSINRVVPVGAESSSTDKPESWWPFFGTTKNQVCFAVDLELDEDFDLKDFRAPQPTRGDPMSRLEELQKKSALAATGPTHEQRHSSHLIGMSMI